MPRLGANTPLKIGSMVAGMVVGGADSIDDLDPLRHGGDDGLGLYHGTALVIERRSGWPAAVAEPGRWLARRALALLIVIFGWVLFRSPDLSYALTVLAHMVVLDSGGLTDVVDASLTNQRLLIMLLAARVFVLPAHPVTGPYLEAVRSRSATVMRVGVMTAGLFYSALLVATGTFSPCLYYQF